MVASTPSTRALTGADAPAQVLGEARVVGLVDLEIGGPCLDQLAQLEVHDARDVERKGFLARVVLVPDPLDERVRAGDRDLRPAIGEPAQEAKIVAEPEGGRGHPGADHAVVEVVVEALGGVVDLHAGQAHREVVDHVVAPQLPVGDDVDARHLLVLDRRLDRRVVDLLEVVAADAPVQVVVLHALEPPRHGITSDDGGRQQRRATHDLTSPCIASPGRSHQSRGVVKRMDVRDPGR
jgi:hypothetical protein